MGDDFVGFSAETGFSADFFTISWVFLEGCKLWMFTGDDWVWVPSCHLTRLQNPEFIEFINKHTHIYIYIYLFPIKIDDFCQLQDFLSMKPPDFAES